MTSSGRMNYRLNTDSNSFLQRQMKQGLCVSVAVCRLICPPASLCKPSLASSAPGHLFLYQCHLEFRVGVWRTVVATVTFGHGEVCDAARRSVHCSGVWIRISAASFVSPAALIKQFKAPVCAALHFQCIGINIHRGRCCHIFAPDVLLFYIYFYQL